MCNVAIPTDPQRSDAGVAGACTPPVGRYRRVPVQTHEADPDAPEVARRLIALISTHWPGTAELPTCSAGVAGHRVEMRAIRRLATSGASGSASWIWTGTRR